MFSTGTDVLAVGLRLQTDASARHRTSAEFLPDVHGCASGDELSGAIHIHSDVEAVDLREKRNSSVSVLLDVEQFPVVGYVAIRNQRGISLGVGAYDLLRGQRADELVVPRMYKM